MRALPIRINMYVQPVLHPVPRNHISRRNNAMFLRQLLLHLALHRQLHLPRRTDIPTSGVTFLPFSLDSHSCCSAGLFILCFSGFWFVVCGLGGRGMGSVVLGEDRVVLSCSTWGRDDVGGPYYTRAWPGPICIGLSEDHDLITAHMRAFPFSGRKT
jgi:hypothetical protein